MVAAAVAAGIAYLLNRQTALMHLVQGAGLIVVLEGFVSFPAARMPDRHTDLDRFRERVGWIVLGLFWLLGLAVLVYGVLEVFGWA